MSKDFTIDELYNCIKEDCGLDELLLLLAEYINDERITKEVEKVVDALYEEWGFFKQ